MSPMFLLRDQLILGLKKGFLWISLQCPRIKALDLLEAVQIYDVWSLVNVHALKSYLFKLCLTGRILTSLHLEARLSCNAYILGR